jgi:hypothetical protein
MAGLFLYKTKLLKYYNNYDIMGRIKNSEEWENVQ